MLLRLQSIALVVALATLVVANEPSLSELNTSKVGPLNAVGVEFSQLFLRTNGADRNARVYFGRGDNSYSFGINSAGAFSIATTQGSSKTTPPGDEKADKDIFVVTKDSVVASNIVARTVSAHDQSVNNIPQFVLDRAIIFSQVPENWTPNPITTCNGISFITMNDSKKSIRGVFTNVPKSAELVKLSLVGHFIDDWQGESVYLKVNGNYVWTDSHELRTGTKGINVCGSDRFVETKFTVPIEVTLPSNSEVLDIEIGTTLEDGSTGMFGISSISLFTRSK